MAISNSDRSITLPGAGLQTEEIGAGEKVGSGWGRRTGGWRLLWGKIPSSGGSNSLVWWGESRWRGITKKDRGLFASVFFVLRG